METNLLCPRGTPAPAQDRLTRNVMRPARTAIKAGDNTSQNNVSSFRSFMPGSGPATAGLKSIQQAGQAGVNSTSQTASNTTATGRSAPATQKTMTFHSPMGTLVFSASTAAVKAWEPQSLYFYTHLPEDYRNDPRKMAEFAQIYGPRALAVFQHFGTVPENQYWGLTSTEEQRDFFREDGVRVSFSVIELMNMDRATRSKYVDVSNDQLLSLYWNNNYELRFPTKASAFVGA